MKFEYSIAEGSTLLMSAVTNLRLNGTITTSYFSEFIWSNSGEVYVSSEIIESGKWSLEGRKFISTFDKRKIVSFESKNPNITQDFFESTMFPDLNKPMISIIKSLTKKKMTLETTESPSNTYDLIRYNSKQSDSSE